MDVSKPSLGARIIMMVITYHSMPSVQFVAIKVLELGARTLRKFADIRAKPNLELKSTLVVKPDCVLYMQV